MENIEQTSADKISPKDKELMENFHYRNYPFSYPNIYGNPTQTEYAKKGNSGKPKKKGLIILSTIGVIIVTTLIIGGS